MHHNYRDILDRVNDEPTWYDSNGVPRFGKFEPGMCPNIYSSHVGLFLIACQDCGKRFRVEMHADIFDQRISFPPAKWHYGDPPIHGCVGDTMNCDDLAVLEFWTKVKFDWKRNKKYEGIIDELPDPSSDADSVEAGGQQREPSDPSRGAAQ